MPIGMKLTHPNQTTNPKAGSEHIPGSVAASDVTATATNQAANPKTLTRYDGMRMAVNYHIAETGSSNKAADANISRHSSRNPGIGN